MAESVGGGNEETPVMDRWNGARRIKNECGEKHSKVISGVGEELIMRGKWPSAVWKKGVLVATHKSEKSVKVGYISVVVSKLNCKTI